MATQAARLSALRLSRRALLISMVGAVSAVLGLGLWASGREMDTAIARLGDQQAFLALAVAEDVGSRISRVGRIELVFHVDHGAEGAHGTSARITLSLAAPLRAASSNTEGDIT